jgi:hypothetical protein
MILSALRVASARLKMLSLRQRPIAGLPAILNILDGLLETHGKRA